MSRIRIGDTVAFRRSVATRCPAPEKIASIRGTVTAISEGWLFLRDAAGRERVMPSASMSRVAKNGLILELV
jgi:hypothetical protein